MAGGDREDEDSILSVIVRRNLEPSAHGETQERGSHSKDLQKTQDQAGRMELRSRALLHLHTVRLDREGITVLKNLEMVKEVKNLYLQENQIKKIENLDVLQNLRFLSLSWNRVEEIQNLRCLKNLQFLDISHNLIKNLDASELPPSLLILDLTGNPCTKATNYRQQVLETLPFLQKLDGETTRDSASNDEEEEDGSISDDSEETCLPFDASGGLSSVSQEIIQRSYQRRRRALREHEERLSELSDIPDKQLLISPRDDAVNAVPEECPSTSLQQGTKPQNVIVHSEQQHQSSALVKKQLRDQRNNATCMPASKTITKDQVSASSCRSGPERSGQGLNITSSNKRPQSRPDTLSTGKTRTVTISKDRQAISAPSTRIMHVVPNKNTLQAPMKTPATHNPTTTAVRPQNVRQATSAPTKKTSQSKEKLQTTQLKVTSSAQGPRRKTLGLF
ncbi:leucine-rich repeat-containing protein 46 [Hyla sarda]|uniref:leucine-rich repeat-containing protein 46 n=1 Tax=Hyla sarda TaxID=327740 RepID=UPI0024C30539|nr:leucine-rich repeat-containing protein 46 [Hyla sarda]